MSEEAEARNALLNYFSSRASAHATQLLTLAIVGLTIVGLWPHTPTLFSCIVFAASLAAVLVSGLWLAGRMVYWSYLSHTILLVTPPRRLGVPDADRLHSKAAEVVGREHRKWAWFSSLSRRRLYGLAAIGILVLVIEVFLFGCLACAP